jgi:hypothetical protein
MAKVNGNGKIQWQNSKVNLILLLKLLLLLIVLLILILILILKNILLRTKAPHFQLTRFLLYGFITTN